MPQKNSSNSSESLATYRAFAIRGKEDGVLLELPLREPTDNEIRIKVAYVGICGSDLHYYFAGANGSFAIKEPLIPGHEVSGTIDLDPRGKFAQGTPVAIFPAQGGEPISGLADRPHLWRGVRYFGSAATSPHTQGAMAEYIYVQREMVRPLPPGLDVKSGALAEPLAVAIHGVKLAGNLSGKKILISGAGPIGLLMIGATRAAGATEITSTDLFDEALARAEQMGANKVINISQANVAPDYYDVIFECSGNVRAVNSAIISVQRGGAIVQVGMISAGEQLVDIGLIVTKEIKYLGAFRFNDEMDEALTLLAQESSLNLCITDQFPLEQIREAFELARDSRRSGKVVLAC